MQLSLQMICWNFDSTCFLQQLGWISIAISWKDSIVIVAPPKTNVMDKGVTIQRILVYLGPPFSEHKHTITNHPHSLAMVDGGWSDVWKPKITFYDHPYPQSIGLCSDRLLLYWVTRHARFGLVWACKHVYCVYCSVCIPEIEKKKHTQEKHTVEKHTERKH